MSDVAKEFADAAKSGDINTLAALLEQGVDVNIRYSDVTALAWAANDKKNGTVAFLMQRGADPDAQVEDGKWTPFMVAAAGDSADLVKLMLEQGANPLAGNRAGISPEQIARDRKQEPNATIIAAAAARSPFEVNFSYPLQDRVLQEVFNFARLERVTLVRNPADNRVEAVERQSFSRLDDLSGLRRAFAEHKRRGGKLSEGEVFSGELKKPKLGAPGL